LAAKERDQASEATRRTLSQRLRDNRRGCFWLKQRLWRGFRSAQFQRRFAPTRRNKYLPKKVVRLLDVTALKQGWQSLGFEAWMCATLGLWSRWNDNLALLKLGIL
jgi:hypothetical protein